MRKSNLNDFLFGIEWQYNLLSLCFKKAFKMLIKKKNFNFYHHHVVLLSRISLTLSRHLSLSSIIPSRSSRLHPVLAQICCRYILACCPKLARLCEGVHGSTLLMNSPVLLQQCPTCLVHLIWMVFMMGGRWLYSCCFVGCCLQNLFNTAWGILV